MELFERMRGSDMWGPYDEYVEEQKRIAVEEGEEKGVLKTIVSLVKDGLISVAEGAKRTNMSQAAFREMLDGVVA